MLTKSFFPTPLSLLKLKETSMNLSTCNLSSLIFKLLKLFGTFFNLLISNLSTSDFKVAKSTLLAKFHVATPVAFSSLLLLYD